MTSCLREVYVIYRSANKTNGINEINYLNVEAGFTIIYQIIKNNNLNNIKVLILICYVHLKLYRQGIIYKYLLYSYSTIFPIIFFALCAPK